MVEPRSTQSASWAASSNGHRHGRHRRLSRRSSPFPWDAPPVSPPPPHSKQPDEESENKNCGSSRSSNVPQISNPKAHSCVAGKQQSSNEHTAGRNKLDRFRPPDRQYWAVARVVAVAVAVTVAVAMAVAAAWWNVKRQPKSTSRWALRPSRCHRAPTTPTTGRRQSRLVLQHPVPRSAQCSPTRRTGSESIKMPWRCYTQCQTRRSWPPSASSLPHFRPRYVKKE